MYAKRTCVNPDVFKSIRRCTQMYADVRRCVGARQASPVFKIRELSFDKRDEARYFWIIWSS